MGQNKLSTAMRGMLINIIFLSEHSYLGRRRGCSNCGKVGQRDHESLCAHASIKYARQSPHCEHS